MPNDAINCHYLAQELDKLLVGGRIDKITMPEKDEIILNVRSQNTSYNLLLSASPANPRCHITSHVSVSPVTAPAFCMHLRKHLSGGNIQKISQSEYERIIDCEILCRDELGDRNIKHLIIEIMGKYSNIILVDDKGKISDSIKHISIDTSSKRQVLPQLSYSPPPAQNKFDLRCVSMLTSLLEANKGVTAGELLRSSCCGYATSTLNEILFRTFGESKDGIISSENIEKIILNILAFCDNMSNVPTLIYNDKKSLDYMFDDYKSLVGQRKTFATLCECMDEYYFSIDRDNRYLEKSHNLATSLKNAISRLDKKINILEQKLADCKDLESDKVKGDLITANIYRIPAGVKFVEVDNYFSENNEKITLALDENKTAIKQAQDCYKRYAKKKNAIVLTGEQLEIALKNKDYYESIQASLRLITSETELAEVTEELEKADIISIKKTQKKGKKTVKKTQAVIKPHKIIIDGFSVLVGKNNIQNDFITKKAKPTDIWLHAQKIHGSHAIIESNGKDVPTSVIEKVAKISAFYSKGYQSDKVPVDYTFAKFVRKPSLAPLGKVYYTDQKTVYVTPQKPENDI